jgi:UDP-N-acetylmuramoylalanine--D-glutamate ligase
LQLSSAESELISQVYCGDTWLGEIATYDIILRSPGVPLHSLEPHLSKAPNSIVTSGTNIFLAKHAHKTIGITGTKGKSTTSSLIHKILTTAGIRSILGGNIGVAAVSLIDTPADIYVLELSSYQLEDCCYSPHGAVFINLYPEHLDHHGDFTGYGEAKASITRTQRADDFAILPYNAEQVRQLTAGSASRKTYFGSVEGSSWIADNHYNYRDSNGTVHRLCHINSTKLKGPGNQQNILATLCIARHYNIPDEALVQAITDFNPLPHRLEEVANVGGITFINDSISTVPEATITALETFPAKTVILGGYDRGIPFEALAQYILTKSSIDTVILFPPSGARIENAIRTHAELSGLCPRIVSVTSMSEAIDHALEHTPQNSTCLLSPASPSFPIFKNFEERGEKFKAEVLRRKAAR